MRRIPTFDVAPGKEPENVKGIAAHAASGRLYVSTIKRIAAFDLSTDKLIWNREYEGGCDRLAISPDGKLLYVPSFEGPHWLAVDAQTGNVVAKIVTTPVRTTRSTGPTVIACTSRVCTRRCCRLRIPPTHRVVATVGPFGNSIRPFTINQAQTLCFVNVNELLGFEVGDIRTGKMLHRVEVTGYTKGPVKRHGCPSHGIGLTPDEKELWLADGANSKVHVFDATAMPPKQVATISVRDQPGWITFSLDGRHALPSTGEIIDTKTRRVVATLQDETGRSVQSEKVVEVVFAGDRVARTGDQFGIGRK